MRCIIGVDLLIALLLVSSALIIMAAQYISERSSLYGAISSAGGALASNSSIQAALYIAQMTGTVLHGAYVQNPVSKPGVRLVDSGGALRSVSVNG